MKALTIQEPWCTLIAWGPKRIEVRAWKTKHRGTLLLCAAATVQEDLVEILERRGEMPYSTLPRHALATCKLVACRQGRKADKRLALCPTIGLWAWVLEDVVPIRPFEVRGAPGLFNVDCDPVPIGRAARRPGRATSPQMDLL